MQVRSGVARAPIGGGLPSETTRPPVLTVPTPRDIVAPQRSKQRLTSVLITDFLLWRGASSWLGSVAEPRGIRRRSHGGFRRGSLESSRSRAPPAPKEAKNGEMLAPIDVNPRCNCSGPPGFHRFYCGFVVHLYGAPMAFQMASKGWFLR